MQEVFLIENENTSIIHSFDYKDYYIEVIETIFGGRRITIREKDSLFYLHNFCAGKEIEHCKILVGLAKSLIEKDFPKFPFCSEPKPYFKDKNFVKKMNEIGFEIFNFEVK